MAGQPGSHLAKNSGSVRVARFGDAIVNPFTVTSRGHHAGAFQVGEMPRNLGLIDFQDLNKETHANLVFADEIDQSQSGSVGQCFKEKSDVIFRVYHARLDDLPVVKYYDFELPRVPFYTCIYLHFPSLNLRGKTA